MDCRLNATYAEEYARHLHSMGVDSRGDLIELSEDEDDFTTLLQKMVGRKELHAAKIRKGMAAIRSES